MNLLETEAVKITALLLSLENYAPLYSETPDQHAQLIAAEANLQVSLTKFFRNMQSKVADFVNWNQYHYQVQLDYNVEVIVNDDQIEQNSQNFIKVSLSPIKKALTAGFMASEITSPVRLGLPSTSALIQKLSTAQVASLVGKKVLDDGSIVDNPKAEYNILETVRKDIAQSIKTSLALGETTNEAIARMQDIIGPDERAEMIARTEAVNAYQEGVKEFGIQSDAIGKEWQDAGAEDECADNSAEGPILFDDDFGSGDGEPPAHPNAVFAGTTFVPYGQLQEMVSADYDGPAIEIITSENNNILIGPNHPMLTIRGLVRASELTESDYLVYDTRVDYVTSGDSNINFKDIPIVEDVFDSLILKGAESLIATASHDLHGDRVFCKGEINVIKPTNSLLSVFNSGNIEQTRKSGFMMTNVQSVIETSNSPSSLSLDAVDLTSTSLVSSALSSYKFMRIRFIHNVNYKGRAFDASTQSGLYNSHGFVVSNCRCALRLIYQDEWDSQGYGG